MVYEVHLSDLPDNVRHYIDHYNDRKRYVHGTDYIAKTRVPESDSVDDVEEEQGGILPEVSDD